MAAGIEIKRLREKQHKKLSAEAVASLIGVDAERLRKWEQRDVDPKDGKDKELVEKYFGTTLKGLSNLENFQFYETVKPFQERLREQKLKPGKKQVPFFDAPGQAGNDVVYSEMTPISAPAGTIDVGDLLNDSEAAIRVYGNSMTPNYPPGCVIGLARCSKNFIEPGEVYVIETNDRRLVKRLFYKDDDPQTGEVMCYSDNLIEFKGGARDGKLAYPPFYVSFNDIINLFCVTGVIKRNANSVIINR